MTPRQRLFLASQLVMQVPCAWASVSFSHPQTGWTRLWCVTINMAICIALVWDRRERRAPRARLAATSALLVLGCVLGCSLAGLDLIVSLRIAVANVLATLALCWLLNRVLSGAGWDVTHASDPAFHGIAAGAVGWLLPVIGGLPGTWVGDLLFDPAGFDGHELFYLGWRSAVDLVLGAPAAFIAFVRPWQGGQRPSAAPRGRRPALSLLVTILLAEACVVIPSLWPEYQLAWLIFIPATLLGLRYSARAIAVACLLLGANLPLLVQLERGTVDPGTWVTDAMLLGLLLAAATLMAHALVINREATEALADEERRREAQERAQNDLLGSVFRSMSDGLVLADSAGCARMLNPALARLLGGRVPADVTPQRWLTAFEVRTADGEHALPAADLEAVLRSDAVEASVLVNRQQPGGGLRQLQISGHPISLGGEMHRLVLVTDVSDSLAHVRALESFAGAVAADLAAPIRSLAGHVARARAALSTAPLEVVGHSGPERAGSNHPDPAPADPRLTQAAAALASSHDDAVQMRETIDDYLAYTVAREGVIRPQRVALKDAFESVQQPPSDAADGAGSQPGNAPDIVISAPHAVHGDPALLRDLAARLLRESSRHAPPTGSDRVLVVSRPEEGEWVRLDLFLASEGPAASAGGTIGTGPASFGAGDQTHQEVQKKAHQKAHQKAHEKAQDEAALNVGLMVCEAIVARHGGTFEVTHRPGGSLAIWLTLPSG